MLYVASERGINIISRNEREAILNSDDSSAKSSLGAQQGCEVDTSSLGSNASEPPNQYVADKTENAIKDESSETNMATIDSKAKRSANLMNTTNAAKSSKKISSTKRIAIKDAKEATCSHCNYSFCGDALGIYPRRFSEFYNETCL